MTDARTLLLRISGITGAAAFGFFFFLTFHTPRWVEDFGRSYIEAKVLEKVDLRIDSLDVFEGEGKLLQYASKFVEDSQARIERTREHLKQEVRAQIDACIDSMRDLPDEQRESLRNLLDRGVRWQLAELDKLSARLIGLMQDGYLEVVNALKRDVRIFTATNAAAFLLLLLVSFLKPQHTRALFVPGMLLAVSTLLCAYFYVFAQNWLLTIIQGSYVGFAYALWLFVVYLLLCDVWLNEARVITRVIRHTGTGVETI